MGYVPVPVPILRKAALALMLGAAMLAGACAQTGHGGLRAGHLSAPLPGALSKLTLTDSNLVVHVTAIDATTKAVVEDKDLTHLVVPGDGTYSGDLPKALPVGSYLFTVIFLHTDGTTRTELARTGQIAGDVTKGATTPIATDANLTYANDDGDTLLNIDEIDAGTDLSAATPVVALFIDSSYVDYSPGDSSAEASNVEATVKSVANVFVRTFFGTTAADILAATKGADTLAIPDLNADLSADLDAAANAALAEFVARGGTLILFRASANSLTLANNVFALGLGVGPTNVGTTADTLAAAGTEFSGGPANLPANNSTTLLASGTLPHPIQAIYASSGDSAVARIPVGLGRIVFLGWSWFNARPTGAQDGGWVSVLTGLASQQHFRPKAALLANTTYVGFDTADPSAGGSNMASTLTDRGVPVTTFTEVTATDLTKAIDGIDVLVLPAFQPADLTPDLDAAAQTVLSDYVKAGGTLIVSSGADVNLVNTVFGFSIASAGGVAATLDAANADATPFAKGAADLPASITTDAVTQASLPIGARAIYHDGAGNTTVAVIPVGTGHIVFLGWDWNIDAADTNDAWFAALDSAVRYTQGTVALYADPNYVDYFVQIGGGGCPNCSEATNLEEELTRLFGLRTTTFTGLSAAEFAAGIGTRKVLIIPELEVGPLAADMDPAAQTVINDFVTAGGTLVLHNPGTLQLNLLHQTFGFTVTEQGPDTDPTLQAAATGTFFEGGPASLIQPSATTGVDPTTLPVGSVVLYAGATTGAAVVDIPVGTGHIVILGWDWFDAIPLGATDSGWIQVLKSAIAGGLD